MLQELPSFPGVKGPVVIIVIDGYGLPKSDVGSAIAAARKPTLERLFAGYPNIRLRAHGTAVGMPSDDDMGNSEVGHNAIGAGQVYSQGAALVANAIADGAIWQGDAWQQIVAGAKAGRGVIHFIGLFSDGNVHSHIDHLKAMVAAGQGGGRQDACVSTPCSTAATCRKPARSTTSCRSKPSSPKSAPMASMPASPPAAAAVHHHGPLRCQLEHGRAAAGTPMCCGEGPQFPNATAAVDGLREQNPGIIDQDLPPFVIAEDGQPIGTIEDGDAVVFFNFRGDRAIEITRAFEEDQLRQVRPRPRPEGDLRRHAAVRRRPQVAGPLPRRPAGDQRTPSANGSPRPASPSSPVRETQKFGHVTYFWNGNRSGKFAGETWQEVPSDVVPFEQRPWMKAAEITDAMIAALQSGQYRTLRCNYANGDMVGHTGNFAAATIAIEAVDLSLARLLQAVDAAGGVALITADHGNADEMYEIDKKTKEPARNDDGSFKAKTAHTLNPVPLILYDNVSGGRLRLRQTETAGLSNIAATVANLLGLEKHAAWDDSLLAFGAAE